MTEIISKLRGASSEKDKNKLKEEAKVALKTYYENHNLGDNKTIDNLAKVIGYTQE